MYYTISSLPVKVCECFFLINLCLRSYKLNRERRIERTGIVFDVIKTSYILKIRMVDFLIIFKKYFKQYIFKLCARHFKSWLLCNENITSLLNVQVQDSCSLWFVVIALVSWNYDCLQIYLNGLFQHPLVKQLQCHTNPKTGKITVKF